MAHDLTPKQQRFAEEYLVDLNATQAAKRAGFKGNDVTLASIGFEYLRKPQIALFIQAEMDKRSKKTSITADYVLSKIKETIERCSQAVPVQEFDDDTGQTIDTGEWKFEHNGVLKGCELLGKHLKLFTDKVEHSGKVTWEEMVAGSFEKDEE